MTLKTGDLIVIENTDNLEKPINELQKKWKLTVMVTEMAAPTAMVTKVTKVPTMATESETGKKVKLKHFGSDWKSFENKRLVGIATEILKEEHRDFDVIKICDQTSGIRYCRRYILENINAN